jgi:hypothetical protein
VFNKKYNLLLLDSVYYPQVRDDLKADRRFKVVERSTDDRVMYGLYDYVIIPDTTAFKVDITQFKKFIVHTTSGDTSTVVRLFRMGAADVIAPPDYRSKLLEDL